MPQDKEDPNFVAFIGIDWADEYHVIHLQAAGETKVISKKVNHTPEALNEWVGSLRQQFGEGPIAVCLEQSKGALINFLVDHNLFVLYPINPKTLAKFREAFRPSGAKDDPDDADKLLEIVVHHRDKLTPWKPDEEIVRKISIIARKRRQAVDRRKQVINQLKAELKAYFPQALELTGEEIYSSLATDFLLKWPTLKDLQRATDITIRKFYRDHHCYKNDIIETRLKLIRQAQPLTTDRAILETAPIEVRLLCQLLKQYSQAINEYERQLKDLYPHHPDADIFKSFPGSGPIHSARLASAFGTNRERYHTADDMQKCSGVAPVTIESGKTHVVYARYKCPKYFRQSFIEYAGQSIQYSLWASAYYQMQKKKGKGHHVILRALAFKWIRIMFRCWKNRTPYDELKYLKSLKKKGAEILNYLSATV